MRMCPVCHLTYHEGEERCLVDGADLEEVEDERIGTVLGGRYVLEEVLGEGGMATVYRARHNLVDRPCAVKILHPELSKDATLRERLRREARSAAAISHPNVVEIYDFGETPSGEPYLVMELLDGVSLRALVGEPMALDQVVDLGTQIAAGLARAHDLGVVHRDLKPENVFVVQSDEGPLVKLVDFGLAYARRESRLTATGQIVGTPPYMAPERFKTADVTAAADLYALGILLYEMAAGRLPFDSNNVAGFVLAHLEDVPPRLEGVPAGLADLVADLLKKKPEERPVDAHQVAQRLSRLRAGRQKTELKITTRRSLPRVLVTLDRWVGRIPVYEELLRRAYPDGAPAELEEHLAEMRAALARLRTLRNVAMEAQRELEELEAETVATRERLGHAVHVLAVDLSASRAAAKRLADSMSELEDAAAEHAVDWRTADAQLARLREPGGTPGEAEVHAARRAQAALEAWHDSAVGLAERAGRLRAAEDRERDLSFQVEALRKRLERVEAEFDEEAEASRGRLADNGVERRKLEMRIVWLASKVSAPLRDRPELRSLFDRIEAA